MRRLRKVMDTLKRAESGKPSEQHIYELIWSIPATYGGMTSAMLGRTRQFIERGIADSVTILTLTQAHTLPRAQKHVEDDWGLKRNVTVRNLWHELAHLPDQALRGIPGNKTHDEEPPQSRGTRSTEIYFNTRGYHDSDGKLERFEFFRSDGTIAVIDERTGKNRVITLYARDGRALASWPTMTDLNMSWLQFAMTDREAVAINEHKTIGEGLVNRDINGIPVIQVVHGSHLRKSEKGAFSELQPQRIQQMKNLGLFDAVSLLTHRQYDDMDTVGVDLRRTSIVPNFVEPPANKVSLQRQPGAGIFIGTLRPLKRVDHAITAISNAAEAGPSTPPITLDVYGDGEAKEQLAEFAVSKNCKDRVTFHGHTPQAATKFEKASFVTLTSTSEGLPLVLLEAMARGCVPIAYDIRYGPSDIITNGVNGYLVRPGDHGALTRAIQDFINLDEDKRRAMRVASIERAAEFTPEKVMARWAKLLRDAKATGKEPRAAQASETHVWRPELNSAHRSTDSVIELTGELTRGGSGDSPHFNQFVVAARDGKSFFRVHLNLSESTDTRWLFQARVNIDDLHARPNAIFDLYLAEKGAPWESNQRISCVEGFSRFDEDGWASVYTTKYGHASIKIPVAR